MTRAEGKVIFYPHFYPHQNLDVSVARWSLKDKKPSVYWASQGIRSSCWSLLEFFGVPSGGESGIPIIAEKLAFKPLLEFHLQHLPVFLPSDASSQEKLIELSQVTEQRQGQHHKFDHNWSANIHSTPIAFPAVRPHRTPTPQVLKWIPPARVAH